jgi:hypothetical protein
MQKLLIFFLILASVIPIYFINRWLRRLIMPRKSFVRMFLYFLVVLELLFIYTFLFVSVISKLFPLSKA